MADPIKEKYNIFKGVVGLFDTKLSATVIVSLIIAVVLLFMQNRSLQNDRIQDNEKWRGREVAMYERILNSPKINNIKAVSDSNKKTIEESTSKLDTVLKSVKKTVNVINKNLR